MFVTLLELTSVLVPFIICGVSLVCTSQTPLLAMWTYLKLNRGDLACRSILMRDLLTGSYLTNDLACPSADAIEPTNKAINAQRW